MSTRVDGAITLVIRITAHATLTAGDTYFTLTVKEEAERLWRYNVSGRGENRIAYGKVAVPDHTTALRRTAEICAGAYPPGSTERGLLVRFAEDGA